MYEKLKAELDKRGKNFSWLSKKSGVPQSTLAMMKKRNGTLSSENLKKIADAMNVSMSRFM